MLNKAEHPGASMNALIVCEDVDEAAILAFALQRIGYSVLPTADLDKALRNWGQRPAELIILAPHRDLSPEQVRQVRRTTDVPLTVITDVQPEDILCQILDSGADQIVVRPYSTRLFMAKFRALLRRCQGNVVASLPSLHVGKLTLDPATRTAQIEGHPVSRLTQLEFRLLYTLMLHQGQTLTVETIVERVWGYGGEGSTELVRGLISRLRSKIEANPHSPQYVLTVPGVGYRLRTPQEQI
jgi:DNA-binding response OmpR family regulator